MADSRNFDKLLPIVDGVLHVVIACPDSPFAVAAVEFRAARWLGLDFNIRSRETIRATVSAGSLINSRSALDVGTTR